MTSNAAADTPDGVPAVVQANGRYSHIDAMRAFAVLIVVVAHAGLGGIIPGGSGVTIFFAISGFVITHLLLREREKSGGFNVGGFYLRRLFKLAPPFIVIIAIPTIVISFWGHIDWAAFSSQVFFAFNWVYMVQGDLDLLSGSGVVWSLSIEEQFYIVFAIFWLLSVRSRSYLKWLSVVSIIGILLPLAIRIFIGITAFSHARVYYGTDTRVDGIAMGVLAAVLYFQLSRSDKPSRALQIFGRDWILLAALATYLISLVIRDEFFRETFRYSFQAAAGAAIILYGLADGSGRVRKLFLTVAAWRPIQIIGLASYSIYLVHLVFDKFFLSVAPHLNKGVSILIQVLVGVSIGIVVWLIVEKPFERLKHRISRTAPRIAMERERA